MARGIRRRLGWERYVRSQGKIVAIDGYGASAPGEIVMERHGFTIERVIKAVDDVIGQRSSAIITAGPRKDAVKGGGRCGR